MDLRQVKRHCRIDETDQEEDALLEAYIQAAEQKVRTYLDRTLYRNLEDRPDSDPTGIVINPAITQAMLMLVSHFYEHRSTVSEVEMMPVPQSLAFLLDHDRLGGL